jgi:putative membrane protein
MRKLLTLAATALLISTAAFAQSVGEKTGVNSTLGISPTTADFVKEVAMSDMTEMQLPRSARSAETPRRRLFPPR